MKPLRIGTRRSPLALWQTQHVLEKLQPLYPHGSLEIVPFSTQGDQMMDQPLSEIGGKGVFTAALEQALLAGTIDLAVHSLKDLPTRLPAGIVIGAIPQRGTPWDALISRTGRELDHLPPHATVGTSSLRRAAQLKAYRPDLQVKPIRGNVETRLRQALDPTGAYDATVLAVVGLERLNRLEVIAQVLERPIMLPAPGQGAIAVQCRADHPDILNLLAALDHTETRACVTAERSFLQQLEAGCSLPVAAYAFLIDQQVHLTGRVNSLDGQKSITLSGIGLPAENVALGIALAQAALAQGAADLLSTTHQDTAP